MKPPIISIILPTYNRVDLLRRSIDSVLSQTFHDWELIIVDDGSTDDTKTLVMRYQAQDARVRYIRQEKSNQSIARNAGAREAKGKYLGFLDSDDEFLPNRIESQLQSQRSSPGIRMSFCASSIYEDDGALIRSKLEVPLPQMVGEIYPYVLSIFGNVITTAAVMMERTLFFEAGGFDPAMIECEDIDLWARASRLTKVKYVDQVLVRIYRRSAEFIQILKLLRARRSLYRRAMKRDPNLRDTWEGALLFELYSHYGKIAYEVQRNRRLGLRLFAKSLPYWRERREDLQASDCGPLRIILRDLLRKLTPAVIRRVYRLRRIPVEVEMIGETPAQIHIPRNDSLMLKKVKSG